jgi:hypothetical protein
VGDYCLEVGQQLKGTGFRGGTVCLQTLTNRDVQVIWMALLKNIDQCWIEGGCDTPIKMTGANNVLKYQSLDQSLVQYIIQVVHSHTIFLFKYKTLQHDDDTN